MGIEEVITAPRSHWQNAFVECVIGSIRRDCLDHVVVLNDRHLIRILTSYFNYYHRWRTHLSLGMESPESPSVQLRALGKEVQFLEDR
jgi:transposase InsO family protein